MEVVLQSENQQQQHQKQQHQEVVLMNQIQLQQIKQGDDHKETTDQSSCKMKHLHVLAVDDSQIDRKILEQLLTVSSYQVTCVDSGDKALQLLGLQGDDDTPPNLTSSSSAAAVSSTLPQLQQIGMQVNLIMTDYSMPGITGYDLLKRIKGSSFWKDVPVVVMSSENVPSRIHMCLEEGAEEFLLKPVRRSDLEKLQPRINTHYNSSSSSPCLQYHGYGNNKSSSNFDESNQKICCCCCHINKDEIMSSLIDHDSYCCKFNMSSQSFSSSSMDEENSTVAPPITTAAAAGASDDQLISSVMFINPPATEALS